MATADIRVGVVVGGRGILQERSRVAGRLVMEILGDQGIAACVLEYDSTILNEVRRQRIDVLYDVTHGVYGRVQVLASLAGRPLVGNPYKACEIYDKVSLKEALKRNGLFTPAYVVLDRYTCDATWGLLGAIDGPVVAKPATADMLSYGVRWFASAKGEPAAMQRHIETLFEIDDRVIVEAFVTGEELCIGFSALAKRPEMFPAMTVQKSGRLFDYEAKTTRQYTFAPASLNDEDVAYLERMGRALVSEFDITQYFYVNAIRDASGALYVFDAGTTVGLDRGSYFPAAARLRGLAIKDLIVRQFEEYTAGENADVTPVGSTHAWENSDRAFERA